MPGGARILKREKKKRQTHHFPYECCTLYLLVANGECESCTLHLQAANGEAKHTEKNPHRRRGAKGKGLANNWAYFKRLSFALKIKKKANHSTSHLSKCTHLKFNSKPAIYGLSITIKTSLNFTPVKGLLNLAVKPM